MNKKELEIRRLALSYGIRVSYLEAENACLRAALERCQDKFLECARIHRGKPKAVKVIDEALKGGEG